MFLTQDILLDLAKNEDCSEFPNIAQPLKGRVEGVSRCLLEVQNGRLRLLHDTVETIFQRLGPELIRRYFIIAYLSGDELLLRACVSYQTAIFESFPDLQ